MSRKYKDKAKARRRVAWEKQEAASGIFRDVKKVIHKPDMTSGRERRVGTICSVRRRSKKAIGLGDHGFRPMVSSFLID